MSFDETMLLIVILEIIFIYRVRLIAKYQMKALEIIGDKAIELAKTGIYPNIYLGQLDDIVNTSASKLAFEITKWRFKDFYPDLSK